MNIISEIKAYHDGLSPAGRKIAIFLYQEICRHLPEAEKKVWHRHPVWFLDGNPIVGYSQRKDGMNLMFWSGQSFDEPALQKEGKFKAAEVRYTTVEEINAADLQRWLEKGREIQWDYKNIVKRKGVLERMNRRSILALWAGAAGFLVQCHSPERAKLRIAIAGLAIESSTFSPALTEEPAFHARYDTAVFGAYPFLGNDSILRKQAEWLPAVVGKSLPGGAVTRAAYESLVGKMLDSLQKHLPYDGLWFDIHGAMSVVGLDDPEGDMIKRIRKVIGPKVLISTSMDLHGNVSEDLARNSDLITCYRMAPHEDAMDTKRRAVQNLLTRLETGKLRPAYKSWIPIPVLLPGEKTSTRIEPGKSIYKAVAPAAAQPGIIDAAIWIGYAWADEPRNHAVVMVTGDDKDKVTHTAEDLARRFWDARKQFAFVAPTAPWSACLDSALKSSKHPFFISDMGDNPTAGGAGDVTWTLTQILSSRVFRSANGPSLIYASIPGPELVEKAIAVGVGGTVDGYAGAAIDARYAPPVHITGVVESIVNGDKDAEVEVSVRVGSVHVIVTRKRKPYHKEADFTRLGLQPRKADIVVVKIGYLEPELYAMRGDWIMALTPGGVDQDIEHLPYKRIQRPMFPMDKDMKDPDLSARLISFAD